MPMLFIIALSIQYIFLGALNVCFNLNENLSSRNTRYASSRYLTQFDMVIRLVVSLNPLNDSKVNSFAEFEIRYFAIFLRSSPFFILCRVIISLLNISLYMLVIISLPDFTASGNPPFFR